MKVIAHQNIGEELDVGKAEMVRELGEKALAVGLVVEDCRAAVSAAGDVIQGIGKINAWRARHGLNVDPQPRRQDPIVVESLGLTPMLPRGSQPLRFGCQVLLVQHTGQNTIATLDSFTET